MKRKQSAGFFAGLQQLGAPEILNSMADGAYITDVNRKILFWNQAAERIAGWTAKDVVGSTCFDNILVHVDKDGHKLCGQEYCPLHRSIVTATSAKVPMVVFAQKKNKERVPVEVTVAPIRNAQREVIGGIEMFRDLSDAVREMIRARMIQEQALHCDLAPDNRLQFKIRYVPNEIVGGDFYRLERVGADHYALMVADVMGHGVAAALYTMQLRSLWEDHRAKLATPAAFLETINERLLALARNAGYFATGIALTLDAATGAVRYVRAGHPAPLILRTGGQIQKLTARQPALGMFSPLKYRAGRAQLRPGDTLLLYTDGAIEIHDAQDKELGEDGLEHILRQVAAKHTSGAVNLELLEERLLRYSNQLRLADDLTLLTVRRMT